MTMPHSSLYRIGAISKFSGIPVTTLRIWQTRYGAFSPSTTSGQHRLYSEHDLHKARLLKLLTQQSHGIGQIANLPLDSLQALLDNGNRLQGQSTHAWPQAAVAPAPSAWAVVGSALAQRLQTLSLHRNGWTPAPQIQHVWPDVAHALTAPASSQLDVLVISLNGLNDLTAQQALAAAQHLGAKHTLVLYRFGQRRAMAQLASARCQVHQEPLSDVALGQLLQNACPTPVSASATAGAAAWRVHDLTTPLPARQFSDAVLQRVANIPSTVLCECPRHVAEMISQLSQFEDYSRDCLSQSPKDAVLHAQLNTMAATARALFEQALQLVADHEGISLKETA